MEENPLTSSCLNVCVQSMMHLIPPKINPFTHFVIKSEVDSAKYHQEETRSDLSKYLPRWLDIKLKCKH